MKTVNFKRSLLAASISTMLAISSPAMAANNTAGSMKGTITDASSHSALAGATVTIVNKDNGASTSVTVNDKGTFKVPSLSIGDYKITITKPGYETQVIESAKVTIGNEVSIEVPMTTGDVERISVTGSRVAMVDTSSPEISLTISADEIARLPISQDVVSVALLAPGTTQGDSAFGNLASFGGSSVAENTFIINGVNVTSFRRGTSIADIPFNAYDQFQVKTGGYSAQFGRSTGGVVNAVTKRGNNGWDFGVAARWEPDELREKRPTVKYPVGNAAGTIQPFDTYWNNDADELDDFEAEFSVSGDIIEDTLFVYGLVQAQDYKSYNENSDGTRYTTTSYDDPLWLARVDWQITDNHSLMAWGFSDSEEVTYNDNSYTDMDSQKLSIEDRGGTTWSTQYVGRFTDWLSMDALYAEVEFNSTVQAPEDETCPAVYDTREGFWDPKGCWQNFSSSAESDLRKQTVVNLNIDYFDDHAFKVGYDYENNTSFESSFYSGHVYYRYGIAAAGESLNGVEMSEDTEYVRTRIYENGGEFTSKSTAWYIEDTWSILPNLTARIGLRSESFENLNADGNTFIEIENQLAPRLGISWDPMDDGESKIFANWGRYHIPVASNTNVRLAGSELYTAEWNELLSVGPDDLPTGIGAPIGEKQFYADGTVADPAEILDTSIDPMYQDELIIGYQRNLDEDWSTGIKFTHRDLKSIIDDVTIDKGIRANGWVEGSAHTYVLTNPNTDVHVSYDTDGDGTLEQVVIAAADLGYPEPERIYNSVELTLNRTWNDDWAFNASYTWAQSYGNAEGYVKSDNGQDDAGLTTDWDFPYLMDGANGYLPNDRRHTIKAYGAYQIIDNLSIGANLLAQSGRPKSAFADTLPADYGDPYEYGATYYPYDQKCERGCMGREDWRFKMDLNLVYNIDFSDSVQADLRLDVFNVFNSSNVLKTSESLTIGGQYDPSYGLPEEFEEPRYVRISANIKF
ncbi:TonB-dependent receptor [uncultured Shewanella sp.]|uniref:TonB-dependent receptor n=1 Tax=uncultured Shewanella sp. TaxID=173975 RepID=UPI0026139505|nr:TonB-dependent receptor [uncultured Shewanella sp.]